MTKDEFIQQRVEFEKSDPLFQTISSLLLMVFAIAGIPIAHFLPDVIGFCYIAFLFSGCILYIWFSARRDRMTGLLCHSCQKPLLRRVGDQAITTGICLHCGQSAFRN